MIINQDLHSAIAEAEAFELEEEYRRLVCLKDVPNAGVRSTTVTAALANLAKYLGPDESGFIMAFFTRHSVAKCVLPLGHPETCRATYANEKLFASAFANKIKDCDKTPGDDDILFKNRAARTFPIQVSKRHYTNLNSLHRWKKSGIKMKAAIPIENAGTGFTVATAQFDFAALLMLQKGISHTLPKPTEDALKARAHILVERFSAAGVYITDKNGNLCDAVLGYTLEPEWYKIDDKTSPNQIQFGHVLPLRADKYMTRGGNVIPITRRGNLIQSDSPLNEVHEFIKDAYQHTAPR